MLPAAVSVMLVASYPDYFYYCSFEIRNKEGKEREQMELASFGSPCCSNKRAQGKRRTDLERINVPTWVRYVMHPGIKSEYVSVRPYG